MLNKWKLGHKQTFNCASAECVADDELLAAESPQWVWPTGPVAVNILAAAKVWKITVQIILEDEKKSSETKMIKSRKWIFWLVFLPLG